jgi:hypothetical protein
MESCPYEHGGQDNLGQICHFSYTGVSVPWDNGTFGTKPKELCPSLPREGSRVRCRTCTITSGKLCQERPKAGRAPSSWGRSGPDRTWGPGSPYGRCPHTRSPQRAWPKRLSSPLLMKGVARSNRLWLHCHMSPVMHGHETSVGAGRQDNTK